MNKDESEKPAKPASATNPMVLVLASLIAARRKAKEQQTQTGDKLTTLLATRKKLSEVNGK